MLLADNFDFDYDNLLFGITKYLVNFQKPLWFKNFVHIDYLFTYLFFHINQLFSPFSRMKRPTEKGLTALFSEHFLHFFMHTDLNKSRKITAVVISEKHIIC